jgi:uncharacterized membrane protein
MAEQQKKPPVMALILNLVGLALIGVGAAELFIQIGVTPEPYRFEYFDVTMIVVGFLLFVPLIVLTMKRNIKAARDRKSFK